MRCPSALFVAIVSLFVCSPTLVGQVQVRRDPQAILVFQQSLAAMGGTGSEGRILDSVTQATLTWPQNLAAAATTTTLSTKGADQIRIDNSADGKTASVIHSRGRVVRSAGSGWRVAPSANSRFRRIEHLPALLLAQETFRSDYAAEYVALEKFGPQEVHHIILSRISAMGNDLDAKFTKDSEIEIFIDAKTLLVLKVTYTYFSEIDWRIGLPMEINYSDYRNVGGMMVPFAQRTLFNGKPMHELRLTSVVFNQGVSDTVFVGR